MLPLDYNDKKLHYVKQYANKYAPDVLADDETGELYLANSSLIDVFIVSYDRIIARLPRHCTEENYKKNRIMQKCLQDLGLDSDALWGFLVFLYYVINQYKDNVDAPLVTIESELKRLGRFLCDEQAGQAMTEKTRAFLKDETLSITATKPRAKVIFSLPRVKVEITDERLLNVLTQVLLSMNGERTMNYRVMVPCNHFKLSLRATGYWMLKTISNELITGAPTQGKLFGKEIKLYLCILELFGYYTSSKADFINKRNYIIVRRLFQDYKDFDFEVILESLALHVGPLKK